MARRQKLVGCRLREWRTVLGVTQRALADAAERHLSTIQQYERGTEPGITAAWSISLALGVDMHLIWPHLTRLDPPLLIGRVRLGDLLGQMSRDKT